MFELSELIAARVERRFENGDNHFLVRSLLADLALLLSQDRNEIIIDANERVIRLITDNKAEAVIYAIRGDHGNSDQDSADFLLITKREGIVTHEKPHDLITSAGERYVTRASTASINDQPDIL